jgi:hypothetical protein
VEKTFNGAMGVTEMLMEHLRALEAGADAEERPRAQRRIAHLLDLAEDIRAGIKQLARDEGL